LLVHINKHGDVYKNSKTLEKHFYDLLNDKEVNQQSKPIEKPIDKESTTVSFNTHIKNIIREREINRLFQKRIEISLKELTFKKYSKSS